MSLVSDALRKARRETARLHAGRHGGTISLPGSAPPRRGWMLSGIAVGVALGLAVVLAMAVALRWPPARGSSGTPLATVETTDRTGPPKSPAAAPVQTERITAMATPTAARGFTFETPSSSTGTRAEHPVPINAPPAALPQASPPADQQELAPLPSVPSGSQAAYGVDAQRDPGPAERVFVLRADLGYVKLELDYIVYKPSAPFGRVNGQDIVPGSIVAGFLVEEIGRDFVRLRDPRGPIVLRVR